MDPTITIAMSTSMHHDDETDTSSLSDYDSEWTQIHSGDESDAVPSNSSFSQRESESLDGDGWEGLTTDNPHFDDENEDSRSVTRDIDDEVLVESSRSKLRVTNATDESDIEAALDMSLNGTLEAIRQPTNNSTPLARSLTDSQSKLKLSFPDPLSRFNESTEITTSYEDVHLSDNSTQGISSEQDHDISISEHLTNTSLVSVDPGNSSIPEVSVAPAEEMLQPTLVNAPLFTIVLYGANTVAQWSIAERLLKLAFDKVRLSTFDEAGRCRNYHLDLGINISDYDEYYVRVIDAQHEIKQSLTNNELQSPTVAVIFLPFTGSISNHDHYLPLISRPSSDSSDFSENILFDSAQYSLHQLNIPENKLITLGSNAIIDEKDLDDIRSARIVDLFAKLTRTKNVSLDPFLQFFVTDFFSWLSRYSNIILSVVILFAGIIGFVINDMNAKVAIATIPANLSMITEQRLHTSTKDCLTSLKSALPAPTSSTSLVPNNLKEKALAVFQPSTDMILSTSRSGQIYTTLANPRYTTDLINVPETSAVPSCPACHCDCRPISWSERFKRSTDLILRPINTLQVVNRAKSVFENLNLTTNGNDSFRESAHTLEKDEQSLSTRIYQSFYTAFDFDAIIGAVSDEVKVLIEALDDLLTALNRSAELITRQWADISKLKKFFDRTNNQFTYRNSRAQLQAKNLKNYCGELAWTAVDTVKTTAFSLFENSVHRARSHRRPTAVTKKRSSDNRKTERHAGWCSTKPDNRRAKRGTKEKRIDVEDC